MGRKQNKVTPTFTLKGTMTDGHDEHVLVLSTMAVAVVLAGLESMLKHEGHLMPEEERTTVSEFAASIRSGLEESIAERQTNG